MESQGTLYSLSLGFPGLFTIKYHFSFSLEYYFILWKQFNLFQGHDEVLPFEGKV